MEPLEPPISRHVRPGTAVLGHRANEHSPAFVGIVDVREGEESPMRIRFDSSEEVMELVGALLAVAQDVLADPDADIPYLDDIDRSDLTSDLDGLGLSFTDDDEE